MNPIFNFFMVSVFLISISIEAQEIGTIPSDTSYTTMYSRLKELYSKQQNSKTQLHFLKLRQEFTDMARIPNSELSEKSNVMEEWLANNIKNTDFKSYDDAVAKWKLVQEANTVATKDNVALYDYLNHALKIHGTDIYSKVVGEVERKRLLENRERQ